MARTFDPESLSTLTDIRSMAARYDGRGGFEVKPAAPAELARDEVRLRVEAAGICGTDLHITQVPTTYRYSTDVLGHELCGEVIEGPGELLGTRAAVDPVIVCGTCAMCLRGLPTQCEIFDAIGITRRGGFATHAAVPASLLRRIPEGLPAEAAVLTEPLACVLYGLARLPPLEPAGSALVLGGGPIGALFAIVLERASGRAVTVSEPSADRRRLLASRLSGDVVAPDQVADAEPAELVVDTTGFLFDVAVQAARPGGTILCFGLEERRGDPAQVQFTKKELRAVSSIAAYGTFGTAIDLLARGVVAVDDVVTATHPLSEIEAAFAQARAGDGLKVLVVP